MITILVAVSVIVILLLLIGVPFTTILGWGAFLLSAVLTLAVVFIFIFFTAILISLPKFHRAKGCFVRFSKSEQFEHAVYQVGEKEYICFFPAENVGRKRIYDNNKEQRLLIRDGKQKNTAYDRHSMLIILVGTLFSSQCLAATIFIIIRMLRM